MGKELDWVREEPTGRLSYRRVYPADLRPYLAKPGQRELKVSLGARFKMTDDAWRAYSDAKRRYDLEVQRARTARALEDKEAAGVVDRLTPEMIAHLVADYQEDLLTVDDEVRWLPRDRERKLAARATMKAEIAADLADDLELRSLGDIVGLVQRWGSTATDHAAHRGVLVDTADPEFLAYVRALHDGIIEASQIILRRLSGEDVPTPKAPPKPFVSSPAPSANPRTVSELLKSYKDAKWAGWSASSRTAIAPVFRVLEDTLGNRDVRSITREDARSIMSLVQQLPAGMGRKKELEGLSVPAAIEKGRQLDLSLLSPGTINRGYLAHISAIFGWAEAEDWADKNPFKGLLVHDPVAEEDKRDPFTADQLAKLFSAAPWASPASYDTDRPGRYWVPLIALFTGMRLGEPAGLRMMDIEEHDGVHFFNIRPYAGRTLKNAESRREVPVHPALVKLGFLPFVHARRQVATAEELVFPDAKANIRGQWGAKLSEWFSGHLKARGITGTKLGFHSFRHNFEDRLRAAKLHGTPIGLRLAGRKAAGSAGAYGTVSHWPIGWRL